MKKILTAIAIFLFMVVIGMNAQSESSKIVGTWKLKSAKYGESPKYVPADSILRLKFITPTHFIWVHYMGNEKIVRSSAGGRYTLEGDVFTENVDFGLGMDKYLGTKSVFNVKFEGNTMYISGNISGGLEIEEEWERVK